MNLVPVSTERVYGKSILRNNNEKKRGLEPIKTNFLGQTIVAFVFRRKNNVLLSANVINFSLRGRGRRGRCYFRRPVDSLEIPMVVAIWRRTLNTPSVRHASFLLLFCHCDMLRI